MYRIFIITEDSKAHVRVFSPYSEKEVDVWLDFSNSLSQPDVKPFFGFTERDLRFKWVREAVEVAAREAVGIEGITTRYGFIENPLRGN